MDDDLELAQRLFATATALLEDATSAAVAGQSPQRRPAQLTRYARQLQTAARDLAVLAEAAGIAARLGSRR